MNSRSNESKRVHFPSANNNTECSAILMEKDNSNHGGIIVLHEWWGLTEQFQEIAADISDETGLTALIPDLYRGKVADTVEEAEKYMDRLNWEDALAEVRGAAEFLRSKGCTKVVVVGKCMGGALSLAAALKLSDVITAAVAFYGIPDQKKYNCQHIKIPIQMHFAIHDTTVGKQDFETLKDDLSEADVDAEFYEYDAGHAFTNQKQKGYLPGASRLSFYRCCEFVNKHGH